MPLDTKTTLNYVLLLMVMGLLMKLMTDRSSGPSHRGELKDATPPLSHTENKMTPQTQLWQTGGSKGSNSRGSGGREGNQLSSPTAPGVFGAGSGSGSVGKSAGDSTGGSLTDVPPLPQGSQAYGGSVGGTWSPATPEPQPAVPAAQGHWLRGNFARVELASEGGRPTQHCNPIPAVGYLAADCPSLSGASLTMSVELQFPMDIVDVKRVKYETNSETGVPVVTLGETLPFKTVSSTKIEITSVKDRVEFDLYAKETDQLFSQQVCFTTIGDWGGNLPHQKPVATAMGKVAREKFVKFVVSTGDNFYPVGVKNAQDPQFASTFENVYSDHALTSVRWYISLGNHDQWGWAGELQYTQLSPRWYLPQRWYREVLPVGPVANAALVVLDSYGRDFGAQLPFLEKELKASASRSNEWKLVLNHAPLFSGSNHGQEPRTGPLRDQIKPLLDRYAADAYFNGDDHILEVLRSAHTDYFVSGGGGGSAGYNSKELPETIYYSPTPIFGFMLHCLNSTVMTTTLYDENGQSGYVHQTARSSATVD